MASSPEAPEAAYEHAGEETLPAPEEAILRMRHAILSGTHWFDALLEAVGRWRVPEEYIGERIYQYLIGGEAFDWLLLAERLMGEALDIVPARELEALLFEGRWPLDMNDDEFAIRLGAAKHSAHLNYLYGVLVEEALQLAIEEDIHKENRNRPWGQEAEDETMFERVYGKPLIELKGDYFEATGTMLREQVIYSDWKAFTYWLFKQRLKRQDKARVASDTRKGLAQLTRMELAITDRRRGASLDEADFARRFAV